LYFPEIYLARQRTEPYSALNSASSVLYSACIFRQGTGPLCSDDGQYGLRSETCKWENVGKNYSRQFLHLEWNILFFLLIVSDLNANSCRRNLLFLQRATTRTREEPMNKRHFLHTTILFPISPPRYDYYYGMHYHHNHLHYLFCSLSLLFLPFIISSYVSGIKVSRGFSQSLQTYGGTILQNRPRPFTHSSELYVYSHLFALYHSTLPYIGIQHHKITE
jgi:hypothetical protein